METKDQKKLRFHGVDIVKVNFTSYNIRPKDCEIKLGISPKVYYPKESKTQFSILMEVTLENEKFFKLELFAIGKFDVEIEKEEDKDKDLRSSFVNVNAPAIMFPYVRSFITTFTTNLGSPTGPIIIPPQFFKGEIPEHIIEEELNKKE